MTRENKTLVAVLLIVGIIFVVWLVAFWPTRIDCSEFNEYERGSRNAPIKCIEENVAKPATISP